jgi:uncharacterized protein (TIGR00730 family)
MPSVCVFCGSNSGVGDIYIHAAKELGQCLAQANATLVYGGGKVGLMGVVADAVLAQGGQVTGVIPDFLFKREVGHQGLTQLEVVQTMHERKKRMADLSDFFIAIPGGWGTLDELAEILTWRQLGLIRQPIGVLNTRGFFSPLLDQFARMADEGFLLKENEQSLLVAESPKQLLTKLGVVTV